MNRQYLENLLSQWADFKIHGEQPATVGPTWRMEFFDNRNCGSRPLIHGKMNSDYLTRIDGALKGALPEKNYLLLQRMFKPGVTRQGFLEMSGMHPRRYSRIKRTALVAIETKLF